MFSDKSVRYMMDTFRAHRDHYANTVDLIERGILHTQKREGGAAFEDSTAETLADARRMFDYFDGLIAEIERRQV